MFFRLEDIAKILEESRVYCLNGQPVLIDSDEEFNRYKGYLVEKITSRDGHIVVEIRPWEAPQAEAAPLRRGIKST